MKKFSKRLTPECFENCMVGLFHDEEDELCKGNIKGFEVGPDLPARARSSSGASMGAKFACSFMNVPIKSFVYI